MARKKESIKPLLSLKHDFYASLDNAIQQGMMLLQAVEFVLRYEADKLPPNMKAELEKAAKSFREAVFSDETEGR